MRRALWAVENLPDEDVQTAEILPEPLEADRRVMEPACVIDTESQNHPRSMKRSGYWPGGKRPRSSRAHA